MGAMSAAALSMFSMVRRSPRRWRAFPPTAMTMRSFRVVVAEYWRVLVAVEVVVASCMPSQWHGRSMDAVFDGVVGMAHFLRRAS